MATWSPISNTAPQYYDAGVAASGFYLKFYQSGTTTPTNMATDSTGGTTLDKCQINSEGYPINGSSAVFIPHINQDYKIILYRNATDADNNTTANAVWEVDALSPGDDAGSIGYSPVNVPGAADTTVGNYLDTYVPTVSDAAKTWYVSTSGNDSTGDGSVGSPYATPQKAWDSLPDIIIHQQTIDIANGTYNTSSRASSDASQFDRPSMIMCNQKWITSRTTRDGTTMKGGVVFKGNGSTVVESNTGFTTAVMYVTGPNQVGLENITLQSDGATSISGLVYAHRGARVHGVDVTLNCASHNISASCMVAESQGAEIELKNVSMTNGNSTWKPVTSTANAFVRLSNDASNFDDGSFTNYSVTKDAYLEFAGTGTVQTEVITEGSVLNFRGTDASNRVTISEDVSPVNSTVSAAFASISATYNFRPVECMTSFDNVTWADDVIFDGGSFALKSSTVTSSVEHPIVLLNGASYTDRGSNSITPASGVSPIARNRISLTYTANSQTQTLTAGTTSYRILASGGSYTGCLIDGSAMNENEVVTFYGTGTPNNVQIIAGANSIDGPNLTFGGNSGDYTGMTCVFDGGNLRIVGLGPTR